MMPNAEEAQERDAVRILFEIRAAAAEVARTLLEGQEIGLDAYAVSADKLAQTYSTINALVGVHARPLERLLRALDASSQNALLGSDPTIFSRHVRAAAAAAQEQRRPHYGPPLRQLVRPESP